MKIAFILLFVIVNVFAQNTTSETTDPNIYTSYGEIGNSVLIIMNLILTYMSYRNIELSSQCCGKEVKFSLDISEDR